MFYEVDLLDVGNGGRSGDAIGVRFGHPQTGDVFRVVIDAGFTDDGSRLADVIRNYYESDVVDLAIVTHPDQDHMNGMAPLIERLNVRELMVHDIGAHGGRGLPAATRVDQLIATAREQGTTVTEPWAGQQRFGALTILGPDQPYYDFLLREQLVEAGAVEAAERARSSRLLEAARGVFERVDGVLDFEVPLLEKEVRPRNNSSVICLFNLGDRRLLFSGDAGVPALDRAWNVAEQNGLAGPPDFMVIPHHGSRRNASSVWLDRLLGPINQGKAGREAIASCVPGSDKHPSGRVINAYQRRGYKTSVTAGRHINFNHGIATRPGWSPIAPLDPMAEEPDED